MKISIITVCYNRSSTIEKAIKSVEVTLNSLTIAQDLADIFIKDKYKSSKEIFDYDEIKCLSINCVNFNTHSRFNRNSIWQSPTCGRSNITRDIIYFTDLYTEYKALKSSILGKTK